MSNTARPFLYIFVEFYVRPISSVSTIVQTQRNPFFIFYSGIYWGVSFGRLIVAITSGSEEEI